MNPAQIKLVKESFEKLVPIKDHFATDFYNELFRLDPSVRPLFKTDMASQKEKLVSTLAFVIGALHNPAMIIGAIEELGKRHVGYGTKPEHYDTVGKAIVHALQKAQPYEMKGELLAAWLAAYTMIADIMKQAAYGK